MQLLLPFTLLTLSVVPVDALNKYGPFTKHFQKWLRSAGDEYKWVLDAVGKYGDTGSFGGKQYDEQTIRHNPVVFIHGNSDSALDIGIPTATGWDRSIEEFISHGYDLREVYGITYGSRTIANSTMNFLNCGDLMGLRRFVEAVLDYTGAKRIDVIGHSMGVTYARKVIQGGRVNIASESCDIGDSLAGNVDALIGISGANYGMCLCAQLADLPACGAQLGFFPGNQGTCPDSNCASTSNNADCGATRYGEFLSELNYPALNEPSPRFIASLFSTTDEILGAQNKVWGKPTSIIPDSHVVKIFTNLSHAESKTETAKDQYFLATQHPLSRHHKFHSLS